MIRIDLSTDKHILINGFSARRGGGQTYLINILEHFRPIENIRVTLLIHNDQEITIQNPKINIIRISFNVRNPFLRFFWEKFYLPILIKKESIDLLFCPGGLISTIQPQSCKKVTMFRNMIPLDKVQRRNYPLGYMRFRNWLLGFSLIRSMEKADLVIFISEYGKEIVRSITKNGIKNSVVIPHGVNNIPPQTEDSKIKRISNDPYIAYVSTVDVYKSQLEVVEAYYLLSKENENLPKLFLVGPWETMSYVNKIKDRIKQYNLKNKIELTGGISYREIFEVYKNAEFLIFASKSENCPNILLESMACSKAVLCSNFQPMPEFGKDAVLYFDPENPKDLAVKIRMLLEDKKLLNTLESKSLDRSSVYDWEECSKKTWSILSELLV